jgi:hypothetical protein
MPGKRQAGWLFSLVTFSLATQRESDSRSAGARKLCFKTHQDTSFPAFAKMTVDEAMRCWIPALAGMTEG